MKQRKKNWVCILCSQTFTRKSSAKRHNGNLHYNNASYIRILDYEIGRIQGIYHASDPAFYKKDRHVNHRQHDIRLRTDTQINLDPQFRSYHNDGNLVGKIPRDIHHSERKMKSETISIYNKADEIMYFVDQIVDISKDTLTKDQINALARNVLNPYFYESPDPKSFVEKNILNPLKENISKKRLMNFLKNGTII